MYESLSRMMANGGISDQHLAGIRQYNALAASHVHVAQSDEKSENINENLLLLLED